MKKLFQVLSILLIAVLLATSALGCAAKKQIDQPETTAETTQEAETPETKKEEPLKVEYLQIHNTYPVLPETDNAMYEWLLENKNIDINFNNVSDKHEDKMNMMLASGEFPDVVSILTGTQHIDIMNKWGDAGYVIPMDEWFQKYPSLLRHSDPEYNKMMYADKKDGKMYMIPGHPAANKELMMHPIGPIYRKDWLQKIGMEVPRTTDELYEVLKAFKEQIPDVNKKKIIPATFNVYKQFLGYAWTRTWYTRSQDFKELTWMFMNPEIEGYLVFMNKLAREGLLDKEIFTHQDDQYKSKLVEGRIGFTLTLHPFLDDANKALREKDPNSIFIPGPILVVNGKPVPEYITSSKGMFTGLCVSKKFAENKRNLERLMEFLDWNATDEGIKMLTMGEEGQYKIKNDKGLYVNKPEVEEEINKPNNTFEQRAGIKYYNLLMDSIIPRIDDPGYLPETTLAQPLWKEATGGEDLIFNLAGTGSVWNEKWGVMWSEFAKYEAKAIFAKSEEECRKVVSDMFKAYETNGGRDIVNEKLKLLEEYLAKNPK